MKKTSEQAPEAQADVSPQTAEAKTDPPKEDLTPRGHAIATGNAPRPRKNGLEATINGKRVAIGSVPRGSWQHESASILHGWREHLHHTGKGLDMSRADYLAALEAVTKTNEAGEYIPHKAALSPHKGKGL